MALEQPGLMIGFCKAAADLSTKQYRCVKVTADAAVNICTAAGENILGVLQETPKQDMAAAVMVTGVTKIVAGTGGLAAGANWQTDTDGSAITAATGKITNGTVLIGAAAGKLATVTIIASGGGTVA